MRNNKLIFKLDMTTIYGSAEHYNTSGQGLSAMMGGNLLLESETRVKEILHNRDRQLLQAVVNEIEKEIPPEKHCMNDCRVNDRRDVFLEVIEIINSLIEGKEAE